MNITINGENKDFSGPQNLKTIITHLCPENNRVIAEINGQIVKSPEWATLEIKDGDTIELVSFVGGG